MNESTTVAAARWQEIKSILAQALDQPTATERLEVVRQCCGNDAELFREVRSLLEQTTSTIENFVEKAARPLRHDVTTVAADHRIGAYVIVREVGRGGMGAVYLAKRADGAFEKDVAIKVLKRGTDTDEVLRQFQSERQILARLVHPNIARLLDAGSTGDGVPYFVMDYVEGKPLTIYADEQKLSVAERLNLFRVVCSAVSYAHQNLIVHRDLKPSNVLVTASGEVKLLDFGIAKLLDESAPEPTLTLQRRLTPVYASPEQLKGEAVTTLSDVYSLGVLLYQLLAGDRPYVVKTSSVEELTRAICEQEPQRPSTVAARDRQSKTVNPESLRGDVDTIVLKSLRKEPSRRYSSVDQLSQDIRRHLEGLPVHARKDTFGYRAAKFIRRHKAAVASATVVALLLIGSTIVTAWQAQEARRERKLAQERFEQVRKLAHSVLFDYHDQIAALPGSTKVREQLVRDSLLYLDALAKQAGDNHALLREIASAYERVGAVQGGAAGTTQSPLASSANLGDTKGAKDSLQKALPIRERLARRQPHSSEAQADLANCYSALAGLELNAGSAANAIGYDQKAVAILEPLLTTAPGNQIIRSNLAGDYIGMAKAYGVPGVNNLGDLPHAVAYMHKARTIAEELAREQPQNAFYKIMLGSIHNMLGFLAQTRGDTAEELAQCNQAAEIDRQLVQSDPTNTLYRRELAIQLGNAGTSMLRSGDRAGALPKMQEALGLYQTLAAADPNDMSIRRNLAVGHRNVAAALEPNDRDAALQHFHTALDILAGLTQKDPANTDYQRQLATCYLYQARYLNNAQDFDAAIESDTEGLKIDEPLVTSAPRNASARNILAQLYYDLGREHERAAARQSDKQAAELRQARQAFEKSLKAYEEMQHSGTLAPADAKRLADIAAEIRQCDSRN